MKNIIIIFIIALIGYYAYKYLNPTRIEVTQCINNYEATVPFRSVLELSPSGTSGESYCTNSMKIISNLDKCLLDAEKNETVKGFAKMYYTYKTWFSTELSSVKHYKEAHNELCKNYSRLLFR